MTTGMDSDNSVQSPTPLNRLEVLKGLRVAVWEGSFATAAAMLTYGSVFLTGFALLLHANNTQIALLSSIAAGSGLTQLLCPYCTPRVRSRRWLLLCTAYPGRMLWLPILLLPFLF